jgi:hypothetical protein
MIKIGTWTKEQPDLAKHFVGAMGVVSCLGHRQPGGDEREKIDRAIVITSIALKGDRPWPH